MNVTQRIAWMAFILNVNNFLGYHKAKNFIELVDTMLNNFSNLDNYMSIKVYYLHFNLECFPENLSDTNEEKK